MLRYQYTNFADPLESIERYMYKIFMTKTCHMTFDEAGLWIGVNNKSQLYLLFSEANRTCELIKLRPFIARKLFPCNQSHQANEVHLIHCWWENKSRVKQRELCWSDEIIWTGRFLVFSCLPICMENFPKFSIWENKLDRLLGTTLKDFKTNVFHPEYPD